jgi:hypothetical protein
MQEETSARDLKERLALIESMIAEGRRSTERWGGTFVLWGMAYYVAIAWSAWGPKGYLSWPVTMIAASVVTGVLVVNKSHGHAETTIGRAIVFVWVAMGIAMFVLLASLGFSGRFDWHVFVAIVGAMLGASNAASSLILKWKMQLACAVVWWAASIEACFGSDVQVMGVFLVAIFFCQIVFGIYGMIAESRKVRNGAHA